MVINFIFQMFGTILVITSFMVIYCQHPIYSLLFLTSSFLVSSLILFLLECEFIAILFIMVYAGAISILFLFAVMMLDMKSINLSANLIRFIPAGFLFGVGFLTPILYEISLFFKHNSSVDLSFYYNKYTNWYDLIDSVSDVEVFGDVLYSYFVLQFLLAGLILLLVLIGVVYLTNNFKPDSLKAQSIFKQLSRKK